ncbi:MAG TPA: protein kinase [Kofleriaceae bacterium]|nr:protein kinase [Kofleriaceae bacterium]
MQEGGAVQVLGDAPTAAATSTTRGASLVRRAFLPSPLEEAPGPARIDAFARLRALFTLSALIIDLGFFAAFRGRALFNQSALAWFVALNVPLLVVSGSIAWFGLRRKGRWYMPLSSLCIVIEMFTSITWIQLTGSVSSYFLLVLPVLILAYRLYATYRLGLAAYLVGAIMHAGAIALEELGALHPAPLFVTDPGAMYSNQLFRIAATASLQLMFLAIFILANIVSRTLREKETALDVVQRNLDRVVAEVQPGRLSTQTLDGKYRLGELLGRGGMGEVYQAERLDGGGEVAVKVLYAHLCSPDDLERFRREAAIAAKLPATHVAQVFDIGHSAEGGHHYLVMELLRGEDLGTLLRRRTQLTATELLPIVDQLAAGLEAAHALGVVHRDLKPQNVFLVTAPDGPQVKLLDFGVARLLEGSELTRSAMLIGSPGYLAPEQAATEFGEVGPRADVFALGTIIYRAVTGRSAFPARNPAVAVYEVVHTDPPPPTDVDPSVPADVDVVISLALAKKPSQRYATPRELAVDLRRAFEGRLSPEVQARARAIDGRRSAPGLAPTIAANV